MKKRILFLAANPVDTDPIALDQEARAIECALERSPFGQDFELVTRWAAEPLDLLRELRRLRPSIVHVSMHGDLATPRPRTPGQRSRREVQCARSSTAEPSLASLFFVGADGHARAASQDALSRTLRAAGASVRLVVLNACYSDGIARVLSRHIDHAVGVVGPMMDEAARAFSSAFYARLAERRSVENAYRQGRAAIEQQQLVGAEDLRLRSRGDAHVGDGSHDLSRIAGRASRSGRRVQSPCGIENGVMDCPDPELLSLLFSNQLSLAERERVANHVSHCIACRMAIGALSCSTEDACASRNVSG